jgi:hypothetical protein
LNFLGVGISRLRISRVDNDTSKYLRAHVDRILPIGANDRLRDFSVEPIHERIAGGVGVLGASDQVLGDLAQTGMSSPAAFNSMISAARNSFSFGFPPGLPDFPFSNGIDLNT